MGHARPSAASAGSTVYGIISWYIPARLKPGTVAQFSDTTDAQTIVRTVPVLAVAVGHGPSDRQAVDEPGSQVQTAISESVADRDALR
jgi:hypothetical protein